MRGKRIGIWFAALVLIAPCAGFGIFIAALLVSLFQFRREESGPDFSYDRHVSGWSIQSSMPTVTLVGMGVMVLLMFCAGVALLIWEKRVVATNDQESKD